MSLWLKKSHGGFIQMQKRFDMQFFVRNRIDEKLVTNISCTNIIIVFFFFSIDRVRMLFLKKAFFHDVHSFNF